MRVFMTGATGFIGGEVARQLRARGDDVVCLVRDRARAAGLADHGCELVEGSLSDASAIAAGMEAADAVIHGAAVYEVGIPREQHTAMYEANVLGTETVLRAALDERVPKVVYVSTIAAFGDTHGQVVDESYEHPGSEFTSYYEQTKYEAHRAAKRLIAEEHLPCVIVQPGGVYGPGDHSALGRTLEQFVDGKLPLIPFPDLGMNLVHVEDVAAGILLALDRGKPGESYVLGGQITTMRETIDTAARVVGRKPPRGTMPTALLKLLRPVGPLVGRVMDQPPNLSELIRSADGVTFWARHDKAMKELGYSPRSLEPGLRDTLAAEGKLS
ncbi:MAG: NAD-dependent epimerase/dehydratase family protein [Solirubrobacterales bacterium]